VPHREAGAAVPPDRIDACGVLDEPAAPPAAATEPAPTAFLEAELPVIELRVGPAARDLADSYPCEAVAGDPDGSRRVRMRVRDLEWARRLVLSLGGEAEVIEPPELRRDVAAAARAALDRYADAGL
jgi:proteasome accessory factor C